jgi:hypothetical protein
MTFFNGISILRRNSLTSHEMNKPYWIILGARFSLLIRDCLSLLFSLPRLSPNFVLSHFSNRSTGFLRVSTP